MKIGVQHNDGERKQVNCVLIVERAVLGISCVVFPIALCKRAHDSVHFLCFARKEKATIGQKVSQTEIVYDRR